MATVVQFGQAAAENRQASDNQCVQCHASEQTGFNAAHGFAASNCTACHAGDAASPIEQVAHEGMIAFPGNLDNAERACGACHANRVAGVTNNLMHTGRGMVQVTRDVFDDAARPETHVNLQSLGHSVADSMLRKQCASCHLGQLKTKRMLDVTRDRGGGCLACHVNDYPEQEHPALTTRVEDGRCFGCHSRSGRISLSYAGLAETDTPALQLADGRSVERLPADAHYVAGMSCIDCHTSIGLMGDAGDAEHQRQGVDIQCTDCHDIENSQVTLAGWPSELASMKKHVPFAANAETRFLTTETNGTPLWQIELRENDALLHSKITNRQLRVPRLNTETPGHDTQHERLTCAACHSQWAPQCFGCHMDYDPDGEQWDHVDQAITAGRWSDARWHVNNALPALGVNDSNEIETFVPGMIMTVAHPALPEPKFIRQFAPLSPHTIGTARSCVSCHRSSAALGLGQGELVNDGGERNFVPERELLQDGLPGDAWTNIDRSLGGQAPFPGQRPFNAAEIKAILEAEITAEQPPSKNAGDTVAPAPSSVETLMNSRRFIARPRPSGRCSTVARPNRR